MNPYETLISKHASLTALVAKIASEDRHASDDEKAQISALRSEVEAIKSDFESAGRSSFLSSLNTENKATGQVVLKSNQSFRDAVKGSYEQEYEQLSLSRLLRGYIDGDYHNAPLERKAMASTPTSAGGILIPTVLSASVIDAARAASVVLNAGALTLPMTSNNLVMPRLTADVPVSWVAEGAAITETQAAFDSVTFTANKMGALVRISSELLEDSSPSVDAIVISSLGKALALALDKACLDGPGSGQPTGIKNTAGVLGAAAIGTPANYDAFLAAYYAVQTANFNPNALVWHARTASTMATLKTGLTGDKTTLQAPQEIANLPKFVSNQIPTNLGSGTNESYAIIGEFDKLAIGIRRNLLIEVSRDYAFNSDQTMIKLTWRGDAKLLQPSAFYCAAGIKP
jgi:HK97 family phage major capsid protein